MRRSKWLVCVNVVVLLAWGVLSAQVVAPVEMKDPELRSLQTQYMDDLSGHEGNWATDRAPGETVSALVKLAGRSLLPMMVAVSAAVAEGDGDV